MKIGEYFYKRYYIDVTLKTDYTPFLSPIFTLRASLINAVAVLFSLLSSKIQLQAERPCVRADKVCVYSSLHRVARFYEARLTPL